MQEAWSKRNHPNLHFMWFEDMKADFDSELEKLQNFLGTKVSGEKLVELKKRVHIDNMQAKGIEELGGPGTPMGDVMGKFFQRKGKVGGLKEALKDDKTVEEWKVWIGQQMEGTDLPIKVPMA